MNKKNYKAQAARLEKQAKELRAEAEKASAQAELLRNADAAVRFKRLAGRYFQTGESAFIRVGKHLKDNQFEGAVLTFYGPTGGVVHARIGTILLSESATRISRKVWREKVAAAKLWFDLLDVE